MRAKVRGSQDRPRVSVFRSNRHVYGQLIDDETGQTLLGLSDAAIRAKGKTDRALQAGRELGRMAKEKRITVAVFDRGGYRYHGRVKAFADGLRESGIRI